MAFQIWELECHEILNLWNKSAIINKVKTGPNIPLEKVLECWYWKWVCIFHLELWIKHYNQKNAKNQIVSLFPNHQNLGNKGQITFEWSMWYRVGKVYSRNTPFSFECSSIKTNMLKLWTCKVAWLIICQKF